MLSNNSFFFSKCCWIDAYCSADSVMSISKGLGKADRETGYHQLNGDRGIQGAIRADELSQ
jgi:putative heme iron utilization protein